MSNDSSNFFSAKAGSRPGGLLAVHTATALAFFAAASAPTPIYRLYQAEWHFSPLVLTLVFAVYPLSLLMALLVAGALSDHVGRRPVIVSALLSEIAAMGLFLTATDPGLLIAARVLQGLSTGFATSALAAALADVDVQRGALANSLAMMVGLGAGALGTAALVQLAPWPFHFVFTLLAAIFAIQAFLTWRTPETAIGRPGALASLVPSIAVPSRARFELLAMTPLNVALWALGGFYLSLMPSLIVRVTGTASSWGGGLSMAALTLSGGAGTVLMRRFAPTSALFVGIAALFAGLLAVLAGVNSGSVGLLFAGSLVAGFGFGSGFLGVVRRLMPLARPGERAGLMAAFYVECYLANSVPALAAGFAARTMDLLDVTNIYGGALLLLVLASLAIALLLPGRKEADVPSVTVSMGCRPASSSCDR